MEEEAELPRSREVELVERPRSLEEDVERGAVVDRPLLDSTEVEETVFRSGEGAVIFELIMRKGDI